MTRNKTGPRLFESDKTWKVFNALGNIALACSFATVIYDIMDTLKSSVSAMTILFLLCCGLGYAAFGDDTPGNILTGFGFYEPYWLVALGCPWKYFYCDAHGLSISVSSNF
ncbi:Amino acid permease 3, partial [Mucuna pruriens]